MVVSTCTQELEYKHSVLTYFLFRTDGICKGKSKETLKMGDTQHKTGESEERFQSCFANQISYGINKATLVLNRPVSKIILGALFPAFVHVSNNDCLYSGNMKGRTCSDDVNHN